VASFSPSWVGQVCAGGIFLYRRLQPRAGAYEKSWGFSVVDNNLAETQSDYTLFAPVR